jgi:hypothetical protein
MHDRFEAFQICPREIAEILANSRKCRQRRPEVAAREEIGIEAANLMAS